MTPDGEGLTNNVGITKGYQDLELEKKVEVAFCCPRTTSNCNLFGPSRGSTTSPDRPTADSTKAETSADGSFDRATSRVSSFPESHSGLETRSQHVCDLPIESDDHGRHYTDVRIVQSLDGRFS